MTPEQKPFLYQSPADERGASADIEHIATNAVEQWLTDNLKSELEQRNLKHVPRIHATSIFGAHARAKDADDIQKHLAKANMLLLEGLGGSKVITRIKDIDTSPQEIARLRENTKGKRGSEHFVRILENNSGSDIILTYLDVSSAESIYKEIQSSIQNALRLRQDMEKGKIKLTYAKAIKLYRQRVTRMAEAQKTRAKYMIDSFGPTILDVFKKYPDLLNKEHLDVVTWHGTAHSKVGRMLPISSGVVFQELPYIFDFDAEFGRRITYDRSMPNDLIQKMLVSDIIFTSSHSQFKALERRQDQILYRRSVVNQLTSAERKAIYELFIRSEDDKQVDDYVMNLMVAKGIPWNDGPAIQSYVTKLRERLGRSSTNQ